MDKESQYVELLVRYFLQEANAEEKAAVHKWLEESEENRKYFEALSETVFLLKITKDSGQIDVDQEWNRFENQVLSGNDNTEPSPFQYNTEPPFPGRTRTIFRRLAYAATAAAVLFFAITLFQKSDWEVQQIEKSTAATSETAQPMVANLITETNSSDSSKTIFLEDGSLITLGRGSKVHFYKPFINNVREITLIGRADFKVAKNEKQPFKVISGEVVTTALGTFFTVKAFPNEREISVKLHEGRIVVQSVASSSVKLDKDVFLEPGQELVLNFSANSMQVVEGNKQTTNKQAIGSGRYQTGIDDPSLPANEKGNWYMFNNQTLPDVFRQLQTMHKIKIIYEANELRNMYFIGKFNKSDSIEVILKQIAQLNDLQVKRDRDTFYIRKMDK